MEKNAIKACEYTWYAKIRNGPGEDGTLSIALPTWCSEVMGPAAAAVFVVLLREEYWAAADEGVAPDGTFRISPAKIAKQTRLTVSQVIRCLDKLSDRPSTGRRGNRHGLIHVAKRGSREWRVSIAEVEEVCTLVVPVGENEYRIRLPGPPWGK